MTAAADPMKMVAPGSRAVAVEVHPNLAPRTTLFADGPLI